VGGRIVEYKDVFFIGIVTGEDVHRVIRLLDDIIIGEVAVLLLPSFEQYPLSPPSRPSTSTTRNPQGRNPKPSVTLLLLLFAALVFPCCEPSG
jgi:hypothetical protein